MWVTFILSLFHICKKVERKWYMFVILNIDGMFVSLCRILTIRPSAVKSKEAAKGENGEYFSMIPLIEFTICALCHIWKRSAVPKSKQATLLLGNWNTCVIDLVWPMAVNTLCSTSFVLTFTHPAFMLNTRIGQKEQFYFTKVTL